MAFLQYFRDWDSKRLHYISCKQTFSSHYFILPPILKIGLQKTFLQLRLNFILIYDSGCMTTTYSQAVHMKVRNISPMTTEIWLKVLKKNLQNNCLIVIMMPIYVHSLTCIQVFYLGVSRSKLFHIGRYILEYKSSVHQSKTALQ